MRLVDGTDLTLILNKAHYSQHLLSDNDGLDGIKEDRKPALQLPKFSRLH